MKRIIILTLSIFFILTLCACGNSKNASSDYVSKKNEASAEEKERDAVLALYDYFGTSDPETGTAYSFSITDTVTIDDAEYYHGRWSILETVEGGTVLNSSLYAEFFLKKDFSEFYKGTYDYIESKADFLSEVIDIRK